MLPLGVFAWFGYSLPLEKRLKMIEQAGFDSTCLWVGNEEEMVRDGHADLIPDMIRDTGLILDNVHAPYQNNNLIWSDSRESATRTHSELETVLEFCNKHRVPIMVAHLVTGDTILPPNENGLRIIQDLVSQAENLGVTIAVENTHKREYLEYILSNIKSPNLGFCYDSSHDFLPEQSRGKLLEKWGDLLVTTHISDNNGITDDHLLPGKGTIDWRTVENCFPKSSYSGALILEPDGPDASKGLTPEEFLQTGYSWLKQFSSTLGG